MNWLTRFLKGPRNEEEERRDREVRKTLIIADDFMRDMRESIRTVQERRKQGSWDDLYDPGRRS